MEGQDVILSRAAASQSEYLTGPQGGDLNATQNPDARDQPYAPFDGELGGLHVYRPRASHGIVNEQPWHAMALEMLLLGKSNEQIAIVANVTAQHVSNLRAQRWFQEKLSLRARQNGEEVKALLRAEAQASLNVMIEVRDAVYAKPSVATERLRYNAAKDLLELAHGKATQTVMAVTATTQFASPSDELADVERQLQELRGTIEAAPA